MEYYPAINEFNQVKEPLFSIDDFEIAKKPKNTKFFFSVNLLNIISVMNLLWEISKKSPKIFIGYINKLEFYFSFVTDDKSKGKDIVMLTPVSENLYNYLILYLEMIVCGLIVFINLFGVLCVMDEL